MLGFDKILGHEQIKEHFQNAVQKRKVSHAYILSGEAGMGRKSLANAFALSLLCEKGLAEPCMQCHACKQVLSKNHPDLIYVTHEKSANIGVDDIREQINDTIMVRPYSSYYKIYIVDEAEKMTVQAQNALLKTLEEPPEYGVIIEEPPSYAVILLLTTNPEGFLPTILSRCMQLKLRPLKDEVVKEYLVQSAGVEESQAEIYAAFARGNLGKAIYLADSEEFKQMYSEVLYLLKHLKDTDISELLDYIRKLKDEKLDISICLDFMQMWYRDVLMYKTTKDINLLIFKNEFSSIKQMSTVSGYEGLERILEAIDKARVRLGANVNMELTMELMLLTMQEN